MKASELSAWFMKLNPDLQPLVASDSAEAVFRLARRAEHLAEQECNEPLTEEYIQKRVRRIQKGVESAMHWTSVGFTAADSCMYRLDLLVDPRGICLALHHKDGTRLGVG